MQPNKYPYSSWAAPNTTLRAAPETPSAREALLNAELSAARARVEELEHALAATKK